MPDNPQTPNAPAEEPTTPEPVDEPTEGEESDGEEESEEPPQTGDPAAALRSERGRRKAAAKKLKEAQAQIAQLKPLADEYTTLLPHLPALLENAKRAQNPPRQGVPDPVETQRLTEVADAFGFQTEDGQPDLQKALKVNRFVDALVRQRTGETVAPFAGQTAQMAATNIREKAYKATDSDGRLYAKKEYIDHVFNSLAPEALGGSNGYQMAQQALVMARGLGGPGEEPPDQNEPMFTERTGRRINGLPTLNEGDHKLRRIRGKSEKDWATLMKDDPYQTGDWSLE